MTDASQVEVIDGFARVDQQRLSRTGFAEVVFGAGKTAEQVQRAPFKPVCFDLQVEAAQISQVSRIMQSIAARNSMAMATLIDKEKAIALQERSVVATGNMHS